MPTPDALDLDRDGAFHVPAALDDAALAALRRFADSHVADRAGVRLATIPAGLPGRAICNIVADRLGPAVRPVRAILFDKTAATNWRLGWHQDRTIAVREQRAVDGFGPWTCKQGLLHVAPPFALLAGMLTVRLHLDPVGPDNAPLRVARGSHRLGLVADRDAAGVAGSCETLTCLAAPGDAWIYATPILHASAAASAPRRRRVLQIDLSAAMLPGGLAWAGVAIEAFA